MPKRTNEMKEAVLAQLQKLGAEAIEFGQKGPHPFVEFVYRRQLVRHGFPGTYSDKRSLKNTCSDLRRRCRELDNPGLRA